MRFNLRRLLIGFAVTSIVCAGLASPSMWWASALATAVTFWLIAAMALAIGGANRTRAFWAAVFVAGSAYCYSLAPMWGGVVTLNSTIAYSAERNGLLTTQLLSAAFNRIHPPQNGTPTPVSPPNGYYLQPPQLFSGGTATVTVQTPVVDEVKRQGFLTIGHAFFAFLLSLSGGALACWAYDRRAGVPQPT